MFTFKNICSSWTVKTHIFIDIFCVLVLVKWFHVVIALIRYLMVTYILCAASTMSASILGSATAKPLLTSVECRSIDKRHEALVEKKYINITSPCCYILGLIPSFFLSCDSLKRVFCNLAATLTNRITWQAEKKATPGREQ